MVLGTAASWELVEKQNHTLYSGISEPQSPSLTKASGHLYILLKSERLYPAGIFSKWELKTSDTAGSLTSASHPSSSSSSSSLSWAIRVTLQGRGLG